MRNPFFKIGGIVAVALVIIALIGLATSPKCPGCGKRWDGTIDKYCYSCQAEQKRVAAGLTKRCAYENCPDYTTGAEYCDRHTCNYEGCNNKVSDPLNGYCYKHR